MRNTFDDTKRFQPVGNAAKLMGVSRPWLYNQCKEGKVPHIRVGRDYRVDMVLWTEMLAQQAKDSLSGGSITDSDETAEV